MGKYLDIKNASEHNLKNIDVRLPRESFIVVTGVSGSGKSSLAYDTIFREGQRKYLESLSAYARQFIGQMKKPAVDSITGISPTISVDQKTVNRNPRSTVGTVTGIYDFFRLMFARLGTAHCPKCGDVIRAQTIDQIAERLYLRHRGAWVMVMAPIVQDRKGEYRKELRMLQERGFARARVDGTEVRLEDETEALKRYEKHTVEAVVDRLKADDRNMSRMRDAMATASELTGGLISFLVSSRESRKPGGPQVQKGEGHGEETFFLESTKFACGKCGISLPEIEPRLFSFNNVQGACPMCQGLGFRREFKAELIVPDPSLSVEGGAIKCITENGNVMFSQYGLQELRILASRYGFDLSVPWEKLGAKARNIILHGSPDVFKFKLERNRSWKSTVKFEHRKIRGVMEVMQRVYDRWHIPMMEKYMETSECTACRGERLSPVSLSVVYRGRKITEYSRMPVKDAAAFFGGLKPEGAEQEIGREIFREIGQRLRFLEEVGLGYLSLDRSAATLSGGESQRIRLASQVGAGLQGVMYILDEPTIGLHARDNRRLLETLFILKNLGNTLLVVEHDEQTMRAADVVLDMGPGAGDEGGQLMIQGPASRLEHSRKSLTGAYLSGRVRIEIPRERRRPGGDWIRIKGARANNLRDASAAFPLGLFTCVTGVSGSGKSTLVDFILRRAAARFLNGSGSVPGAHDKIEGLEKINRLVEINQTPIGRTPRSNPVTYTKVFDHIRELYAGLPESKIRGYAKGRFSFNVSGGRCESCGGAGVIIVDMQLLADVTVPCEACGGKRFNDATLEVYFRGKTIFDVLEMSVSSALEFFQHHPRIRRGLAMLEQTGLGYVRLGQPSTTLSGGEAQRIKLAAELQKPGTGNTLYILDEPTTGLHFSDISRLLAALQGLVEKGNTLIVVEHNLDVIKTADHVIDMGPEGGDAGGEIIAVGTPEEIAREKKSWTGKALKQLFRSAGIRPSGKSGRVSHGRDLYAGSSPSGSALGNPQVLDYRAGRGEKRRHSRDIFIIGASKHNLKHIDVRIPWNSFTVITGVSGSGKSSLALGTLFAEGQRRFVESLSTYARRFLGRLEKGEADSITGLAPAIAIDQKSAGRGSKSTVATLTEIHDYFRLLYARLGQAHCPRCAIPLHRYSVSEMAGELARRFGRQALAITAPLFSKELHSGLMIDSPAHLAPISSRLAELGFSRIQVDGEDFRLDSDSLAQARYDKRDSLSEVLLHIDRISPNPASKGRMLEALESALDNGRGIVKILPAGAPPFFMALLPHCPHGHFFLREALEPRNFSFNSHWGACEKCGGQGKIPGVDYTKIIVKPDRPLISGGLGKLVGRRISRKGGYYNTLLAHMLTSLGYQERAPFSALSSEHKEIFLYGMTQSLNIVRRRRRSVSEYTAVWKGLVPLAEKWYGKDYNQRWEEEKLEVLSESACPVCRGTRLKKPFCDVTVGGMDLGQLSGMPVSRAAKFFDDLKFEGASAHVGVPIVREIGGRLDFLSSVGLGYLGLDREAATLSGGEMQRIRLAGQIGSGLEGVLYVLDEPTVGLHQQDTARLVATLKKLRDLGNTVVAVEHDPEVILSADWIIDMGPGAGDHGGEITAAGTPENILRSSKSLTGRYLSRKPAVPRMDNPGFSGAGMFHIRGARANNLKNIDVSFPAGQLVTICGVSGSGKSSLVVDILAEHGVSGKKSAVPKAVPCQSVIIPPGIDQLLVVDQSPLGASPRSCPITYGKTFDRIRELFALVPEARVRGFSKSRFSMNVGKGRCPACEGMGKVKKEMHFLTDVWVECEACRGKRFNADTLEVRYRGRNIADILDMTVEEGCDFFSTHRVIHRYLQVLNDIGLGYLQLGRPANTLSGGEAQRIKLGAELARGSRERSLFVLDEPTTGLHLADIHRLLDVLGRLTVIGHSVVVIEHHLDVISASDWVVELGPEGGDAGGNLLFSGPPGLLVRDFQSPTARSLVKYQGKQRTERKGLKRV